ncbi:MAG: ribosomal-processing cysteine protease Prp [Longicatena sp.]
MVKVSIRRKDSIIRDITVVGHADSGPHGQDLVCAGVSSITFGMMNALDELVNGACDFNISESQINIRLQQESKEAQMLLEAYVIQLRTLEENYQNNIKLNDQEV